MKIGRNDPCPCGSGLKYKKCCFGKKQGGIEQIRERYLRQYNIQLKKEPDIEAIRVAGGLVVDTLNMVQEFLKPGIRTDEINTIVHDFTVRRDATPAPLNYRGFPKSVCISVNEEICHGIPGNRVLKEGDIANVDVTSILKGYYADASQTFFVGAPGPDALKIVHVARESLKRGLAMARAGNKTGDIGWAIQSYAEGMGCSVVREFVGHGVGLDFHEPPPKSHILDRGERGLSWSPVWSLRLNR